MHDTPSSYINWRVFNYPSILTKMYEVTASMTLIYKDLMQLKENQASELLLEVKAEILIAIDLMTRRHQLGNSIFWNTSRAALRRGIQWKMSQLVFPARTNFNNAKMVFEKFMREVQVSDMDEVNRLLTIHINFYSATCYFDKFYYTNSIQLSLELTVS